MTNQFNIALISKMTTLLLLLLTTSVYAQSNTSTIGNPVELKFKSLGLYDGEGHFAFSDQKGAEVLFTHNFMTDGNFNYSFVDEYGETNKEYVGKIFIVKWEEVTIENDNTGEEEIVLRILSLKLKE